MRTAVLAALLLPTTALGVTLELSGACPGPVSIEASGLDGANVVLLVGSDTGSSSVPGGPCADVDSGLDGPLRWFGPFTDGDGDGVATVRPTLPGGACGMTFAALDLSTCAVSAPATIGAPAPGTCQTVAGIQWCYHPSECGMACNDTCAAVGLTPMADSGAWFEAQNEPAECEAIAGAFGAYEPVEMASWSYGCVNDGHASDHSSGPTPNTGVSWLCSTYDGCPTSILTNLDQLGVACGPSSRMAICACE